MLRIADVGFKTLDNLLCLNMSLWHEQVQLYIR